MAVVKSAPNLMTFYLSVVKQMLQSLCEPIFFNGCFCSKPEIGKTHQKSWWCMWLWDAAKSCKSEPVAKCPKCDYVVGGGLWPLDLWHWFVCYSGDVCHKFKQLLSDQSLSEDYQYWASNTITEYVKEWSDYAHELYVHDPWPIDWNMKYGPREISGFRKMIFIKRKAGRR